MALVVNLYAGSKALALTLGLWSTLFFFFCRQVFHMTGEVPPSMSGTCGSCLNGHMYIFGGCDDNGQSNLVRATTNVHGLLYADYLFIFTHGLIFTLKLKFRDSAHKMFLK